MSFIESLYVLCAVSLSLYGLNSLILTWIYLRRRGETAPEPPPPAEWPHVTVQLPIYNELHTAERLLATVARLNYPRHRLEIQALDDSTDATREIAAAAGARVVHQDWLGYGRQKNHAASLAANDAILSLDADERVNPELAEAISALPETWPVPAYRIRRLNRIHGRPLES